MADILTLPLPARATPEFYMAEHEQAHSDMVFWVKRGDEGMIEQCRKRRQIALHKMVEVQKDEQAG